MAVSKVRKRDIISVSSGSVKNNAKQFTPHASPRFSFYFPTFLSLPPHRSSPFHPFASRHHQKKRGRGKLANRAASGFRNYSSLFDSFLYFHPSLSLSLPFPFPLSFSLSLSQFHHVKINQWCQRIIVLFIAAVV